MLFSEEVIEHQNEVWEIGNDGTVHLVEIHDVKVVDELVAHSCNLAPRDLRVRRPELSGEAFHGFTHQE